ncbi:YjjG family noncanonical pyrimidine nucleotidase [Flavobacterium sp.]|uniref:YjjG family noncanonical pyrimidine nucleotidase n=1 Tax=Flavobacterium sp. TaxID=239 RepID=UPI002633881E|nr:YjjG family noncanonical pyrimidine nucleotidase [Flavobacterium sp.]MDD3003545.1 YjjG family noncanonical pyrimidine nucleotidase [Flavobacterium sp.]
MKPPITDVFFDLDHTLWDFEKNSALTFAKILNKNKVPVDYSKFIENYVPINHQYWELFREEKISKEELRFGRLQKTFELLEVSIEQSLIEILSEEYLAFLPENNHLFEGTLELLEYLQPKYNLHIITNGFQDVQYRKIKNANLIPFFKTITNSESTGVKKPNPMIFEFALRQAQTTKEQSIMIGDCIDADVKGALNFGMDAILFSQNSNDTVDENIKKIQHLLDLKSYL